MSWPARRMSPDTMTSVKIGDFVVPVTAAGELWLYVSPDRRERYISARDVLAASGPPRTISAAINGSIVFVGTSAAGLQDIRTTALGQNVPGVSLHAQTVEQILTGRYLSRPDWADGLEILSIAVLGSLLVITDNFRQPGGGSGLRTADHGARSRRLLACLRLCRTSLRPAGADRQRHRSRISRQRRFVFWSPTGSGAKSAGPSANICRRRSFIASNTRPRCSAARRR